MAEEEQKEMPKTIQEVIEMDMANQGLTQEQAIFIWTAGVQVTNLAGTLSFVQDTFNFSSTILSNKETEEGK